MIADAISNLPDSTTVDPRQLRAVLGIVHAQIVAALWLSLGMILAFGTVTCVAFGWRRPALACGFFYSLTLCFLSNGHAQILGPVGCAVAVMGFFLAAAKPGMIHFLDAAVDGEWMAELKDAGLLAPDQIDRIDGLMGRPETGSLNAFLLAGADLVPEKPWLSWLIRRHGCHRYGKAVWRGDPIPWPASGIPGDGNLPYRQDEDQGLLVAVLRPDLLTATGERLRPRLWRRAAATLREVRDLHALARNPPPKNVSP